MSAEEVLHWNSLGSRSARAITGATGHRRYSLERSTSWYTEKGYDDSDVPVSPTAGLRNLTKVKKLYFFLYYIIFLRRLCSPAPWARIHISFTLLPFLPIKMTDISWPS